MWQLFHVLEHLKSFRTIFCFDGFFHANGLQHNVDNAPHFLLVFNDHDLDIF